MTFLKTLGFTICAVFLFGLLLATSVLEPSLVRMFVVFAAVGIAFYYLFRDMQTDVALEGISMMYISASIVSIFLGFFTTFVLKLFNAMSQRVQGNSMLFSFSRIFQPRTVEIELLLLLIGLFAPYYLLKQFKDKETVPHAPLAWNILCVLILYAIAFLIYQLALARVFGVAGAIA